MPEGAMPGGYHTEPETIPGYGLLEMHPNGYGFLRSPDTGYSRERSDPFVPGTMIERYGLRQGVMIRGTVQPGRRQQGPRLRDITDVDGMVPDDYLNVNSFYVGQRALIVAPPRSGKTILLQHISQAMSINFPEVKQFILLIDERPEEVTDMKRNVKGEVCASSLDEDIESHVRLSQLVVERCRRLAEMGQDVFLLLDSITRLARAFNKYVGGRGAAIQTGALSVKAMDIPNTLFATARAFEEGGSLTICGTALIETNSRMDDAIFQEFKGTGNMELVLDKKLAERGLFR
ncbi:MAG: hypothetical protein K8R36_02425 [Planctomycetales bacterium]|nr:hypothetical protein [Planctomycetales bacterium]